ncbi:DUF3916 domain-containing protein [Bacillus massilinigeriensis]|uniref:DUF3916 domain-containing protein n=1 Tax=Bacillus mediterraneensis TaxID=1805474 RepID=UPI0008F8DA6C|nr:DUF3916 domain-containing protein [Bacillus mediterraneensis]
MNRWKFDNESKKKVRGLRRRKINLINTLYEKTEQLPNPKNGSLGYWHIHLPFAQGHIDSNKAPNKLRREIMQILIDRVSYLINLKTPSQHQYRIYTVISLPNLFDSQIGVIPDKSWFNGFFERDSQEQKWLSLNLQRDLIKEWELDLPPNLVVKGFKEIISDEDYYHEGEIWFIGELN